MDYIGFIYKWINMENNMFYIGSHKGDLDDGYTGSGSLFLEAYKKNKHLFKREILEFIYSTNDLLTREQYYLDLYDVCNNNFSYNLNPKTSGGWDFCHTNPYLVQKRISSIRNGFSDGRVVYNKGKKIEELHDHEVVMMLKNNAKKTIGSTYNRNKGENGIGLKNSYSKIVMINYLLGDLTLICEGTFRKWCHSGTYKKNNKKIWEIAYISKHDYNSDDYKHCLKYDGEKITKEYLLKITENKMLLNVHNRNYYLCTHMKSTNKIITDISKTEIKLKLKGATGKTIWKIETISYDDFNKYKNKIKYYDGKIKLCGETIGEYCSIL